MFHIKAKRNPTVYMSERQLRFYTFLCEHPIGVLSTVTPDHNPHGVVIYFTVDKDCSVSFITRAGTRKHDNMLHNSHAMLTVFEPETQAVVQLSGVAEPVRDHAAVNRIASDILAISMRTSEAGLPPIVKLEAGSFLAYRIEPKQARMAVYARPDSGEFADLFESIESFDLQAAAS